MLFGVYGRLLTGRYTVLVAFRTYTGRQTMTDYEHIVISAETSQVLKNIDTYKKNLETRAYKPRILENLKCVKRGDK